MTHEEGIMLVNAVSGALSDRAWMPEKVMQKALELVPEMSMSTARMMQRKMHESIWQFECEYSRRICTPMAADLMQKVCARLVELEEKRKVSEDEDQQNQSAVQA